uniref:Cullin-9 n=1 Tax=Gadus morhua TaxID=8049 RepID=A0A8C4ZQJ7_GADMO
MVGERRKGNLLVQLGPRQQAFPEELLRQRRTQDGHTEYLVRWTLVALDDGTGQGGSKTENVLMWMSTEDVYANCPTLLGKRPADAFTPGSTFDEAELQDMKEDVQNLVRRARKQMAKKGDFPNCTTHTVDVLSAYAGIGALVGVFRETGALDLLMELLCNKESQTRRSAGKMLRALASHDAGSRAYVLLSLSQQDGIEQHMDFDNRYTLLELFAETTSSEEHGISFEGIHLPQIPGKLLFSLVKRYLCVTSLMDKLNTAGVESSSDRQEAGSASSPCSASPDEQPRLRRQFHFSMAMGNLISELVRVMGWDRNRPPGPGAQGEEPPRPILRSIFQPRFTSVTVSGPTSSGFKTRTDFSSRLAYVEYVQANLASGMTVRMLEDYDEVSANDEGEFRYSNDGSPPVQVHWNSLSRTYWVHWHMVEILGEGPGASADKDSQEVSSALTETLKQTFLSKPPGGLYSLPYMSEERQGEEAACLSRAEWWEVLFFIKKLEPKQQMEANRIIQQSLDTQTALVDLTPPGGMAKKLLHYLTQKLSGSCLPDLLCSHTFSKLYLRRGGGDLEDEELMGEQPTNQEEDLNQEMTSRPLYYACCPTVLKVEYASPCSECVLSLLVELLGSPDKEVAVSALRLTRGIMLKYDWRVPFATEGGVRAVLSCMHQFSSAPHVQQVGLAALKVITGASKHDLRCVGSGLPLSESGTQMMLEIFSSIGSAAPEGSSSLLGAIPAALDLMLTTKGYTRMHRHPPPRTHGHTCFFCASRILNKFLDDHQEDILPWHESIEPCLSSIIVVQQFIRFLYRLASLNKDYAVVMCRLGTKEILAKALDKHGTTLLMLPELRDLVGDCEKYASLYKKMTTSILAGCIQMVLGQIEEHRRSHQPINIPFFDVFLRNLCQGSSVELKEDKCWEKVVVSSNHHRANKLTDKNPKTYWESNGCTGSHFINIYVHKGVVIRQLAVQVASEDSSYMPARILVLGGDDPNNINAELNTVNVPPSARRVVLLENMTRFWSIIQIRIKRCQQGGIDTRVHGFEVLGPKPTFWPVFKEQLCCRTFLFYSTKAHTWCLDVLKDRSQLLLLFNRLNSALKHEQLFADRFLPDAEAAEALGGTCWEALITPIVHSIALPDATSVSALSWLLSEYLENARSARPRNKGRPAIFNCRVRQLTHLLVHVDTGHVEEVKPPVKTSESASSSVAGIALCWQGVVEQQVKDFLEVSCGLSDFVERYRGLYVRLKRAMEELFGQQTAFALALRTGFSSALLQLSILRAVHVSERFAQYIDQAIQRIQVSGRAERRESQERLQQFLEPMLFLSGLEMASTFEHFYRYYLGDRLLSGGDVWLEELVTQHIGSCFPNRFPEQMLKNLAESDELRREFSLYRLQQLDHGLTDQSLMDPPPQDPSQPSADPRLVLMLQCDVHILILSPRCWAVSAPCYLDDPSVHFPPGLCSHLSQFSTFYTHSNRQPRRLQWTWLGHAELSFNRWTLHVSTLQMFILLHFNHQEVHTRVLRLNPGAEAGSASGGGACRSLLPRQAYLSVDEAAADALERKRNYIYCTIVSLMKTEKEIHIDNLVFKVRGPLHRGPPDPAGPGAGGVASGGPSLLPFSCSTNDVLGCIMHVLSQGYLRRHDDSPHIVEYVAEGPATPKKGRAQFSFARGQLGAEGGGAVLFSMGRTMTQDEVLALMQRTVQMVSGTLAVDPDWAEHLLISWRWNVDALVQSYTDDPEAAVLAAGLRTRNPDPAPSPASSCPVCLSPRPADSPAPPTLSCLHYCCLCCWQKYLSARVEQNMVMSCTCPITDCRSQPTSQFFFSILSDKDTVAKYEQARLRGYVESCSNLTWCTNPQGCDQVLCQDSLGSMGTCSKCCWSSCFSCNFPEAHYPASCSHMSQWMDDGGFYEGMTMEAQSKHLAKLISKRCPSCQAQIEKNEGCLHMTCAKCNHGFCWRCLKPWKPTHKDYYNCSAMVSKAARQEKKFQDYNERCTFHNQAKDFAVNLERRVSSVNEALQMKALTFVIDACKVLAAARKVLAYSCVYSYYNQETEKMDVMEQQTEALDFHTNGLQILLEETLLQCTDLASSVRLLKPEHLSTGLELIRRIQERLMAILHHSTQVDHAPYPKAASDSGDSDNNNYTGEEGADEDDEEYDEEYVPEWHDDYDEDDIDEDDFFSEDDESENLERDLSPFD